VAFNTLSPSPFITKNGVSYNLQYESSSGKAQIIQQNAPPGTKPIYQDGSWNSSATQLGFTTQEKNSYHSTTQQTVRNAYNSIGGKSGGAVLPQWAQIQNQGKPPGQTSTTPANGTAVTNNGSGGGLGGLVNTFVDPEQAFKNFAVNGDKFGVGNEKELFGKAMKYPLDMRTETQDNFMISQYRYKPSKADAIFGGSAVAGSILSEGLQATSNYNLEQIVGTVYLPMPNGVRDSNNVSWGEDAMNNLAAAAAANTTKNMVATGAAAGIGMLVGGQQGAQAGALLSSLVALAKQGGPSEELNLLLGSMGASKLLKAQGFGVETESILARGAGIVPNSNLELLFNAPTLRTFSFVYRLSPRSSEEAATIRRIIRFFKQGMAAKKTKGKSGQASFFLGTPNVFRLEYKTANKQSIDGVNKFKTCALSSFSCDYTPDGFWAAYDSGQPVSTTMSMTFNELEPIYDTDYQDNNIFSGKTDLFSINNNAVGY
jgi:hypothetical protein